MSRIRDWHGRNMDIIIDETANKRDKRYTYALAVAIKYILEWIERNEKYIKKS